MNNNDNGSNSNYPLPHIAKRKFEVRCERCKRAELETYHQSITPPQGAGHEEKSSCPY